MRPHWLIGLLLVGCGLDTGADESDDYSWADDDGGGGKADGAPTGVNVAATHLDVDLANLTAVATIDLERNGNVALEAGGLDVTAVHDDRGNRHFKISKGKLLVSSVRGALVVEYGFTRHANADGLLAGGSTVMWPYFCGNVFPCHSQPADGETFSLALANVPADKQAIFPSEIAAEAPPYMLAWAVGDYDHDELGVTTNGTHVATYWLPNGEANARKGTKNLAAVFDWYEQHIGPYQFGDHVASVSVVWGEGMYGGMEHHPFWHVARGAMNDENTHAHEAAHGWFGDGVRIACWEDFVLSEGTVSYLAARALGQVGGADLEAAQWDEYQSELTDAIKEGGAPAWPTGCNKIDIIKDDLFTNIPYMEGAFFYKDVAAAVGADVLDGVLARFYQAHKGGAARMQDMIDAIERDTGFDTSALVAQRLRKKF